MASELREKTISGMLWNAAERFGSSFFLFIANLVLARLLNPDDFGAIAMLMVFISLSETIVDAGFGSALIQKQNTDQRDYSTIFIWNICFAILLYILLFFSAPGIANFYDISILKDVLRVQSLIIPLNSFILVHIALQRKQLHFRQITKINLTAIIIGTVAGIIAAFFGAGVWSLVLKLLLTAVIQVYLYYGQSHWIFSFIFDYSRFKSMFSYASFVFLNRLTNTLYHNILTLIIGKYFNTASIGYYNQARKLQDIPRSALSSIVTNVTFPVFSQINGEIPRLKIIVRKCMRNLSYIAVPLTFVSVIIAEPLFILLFTAKWIQAVPYFQILCLGGIVISPLELNSDLLNAMGKSKLTFNIRIFQLLAGICILAVGTKFGMKGLIIGYIASQYLSFVVTCFFTGKHIGYGLRNQVKDLLPFVSLSLIAGSIAIIPIWFIPTTHIIGQLLLRLVLFSGSYLTLSVIFKIKEVNTYWSTIQKTFRQH